MKKAKPSNKGQSSSQKHALQHGPVRVCGGEAVVGAAEDIFAGFPSLGGSCVYFSVPQAFFLALRGAVTNGGKVDVHHGRGVSTDGVSLNYARVWVMGHCALIRWEVADTSVRAEMQDFHDTARIRFLVASQEVAQPPVVFETGWESADYAIDPVEQAAALQQECQLLGKPGSLMACALETVERWKLRKLAVAKGGASFGRIAKVGTRG